MNFVEHYAHLADDELLILAASRGDLQQEAAQAMDLELSRRGLSYQDAHAKKRQVARLEIKEARRRHPSPKGNKYFVAQIRGRWLLLLLSPTLLVVFLSFPKVVSEKWLLPIMFSSYGVVCAISAVQPWVRQTRSFWLSLPITAIVQLLVAHIINVRLAPYSRSELKGAAFLAILAGYAVGVPLFLLLQKVNTNKTPHRRSMVRIGTAGWVIPRQSAAMAAGEGSHLERYARVMNCVEINSSFHRSHRPATWARWAEAVPEGFRFAVKFPKAVTHAAKLAVPGSAMDGFFAEVGGLGEKLGVVLVQLPPSLEFEGCPAVEFFEALRERWQGSVALEPRHASWFGPDAEELMQRHRVGRVAADPVRKGAVALRTSGWPGLAYFRLHGSPRMYYSAYEPEFLAGVARAVQALPEETEKWVIFDNTALGEAFANAVDLMEMTRAN